MTEILKNTIYHLVYDPSHMKLYLYYIIEYMVYKWHKISILVALILLINLKILTTYIILKKFGYQSVLDVM